MSVLCFAIYVFYSRYFISTPVSIGMMPFFIYTGVKCFLISGSMKIKAITAIVTRFIESHGYEMPEIVDAKTSEAEGAFVYAQDFLDVLQAIVDAAPTYRFRVKQSGEYRNVDVLEIVASNW